MSQAEDLVTVLEDLGAKLAAARVEIGGRFIGQEAVVDLVMASARRNPIVQADIDASKQLIYAA